MMWLNQWESIFVAAAGITQWIRPERWEAISRRAKQQCLDDWEYNFIEKNDKLLLQQVYVAT